MVAEVSRLGNDRRSLKVIKSKISIGHVQVGIRRPPIESSANSQINLSSASLFLTRTVDGYDPIEEETRDSCSEPYSQAVETEVDPIIIIIIKDFIRLILIT
jgi:hypothetical protein